MSKPAPLEHYLVLNYSSNDKRDEEQDQEYPEQKFCNPSRCPCNTRKTQESSSQCNGQKKTDQDNM
jgi:hypothetical protein